MSSPIVCSPNFRQQVVEFHDQGEYSALVPSGNLTLFGRAYLATDPRGAANLVVTNLAVGTRYRVERQVDSSTATPVVNAEGVASAGTIVLRLDYYQAGSALNNLRLKLVDLDYQIEEAEFGFGPGGYEIQSQRRPDPWYSNP